MAGRREVATRDFNEDPGCGPDACPGHRCQDRRKRVHLDQTLDVFGDLIALTSQHDELFCEPCQHLGRGVGPRDSDGLLGKRTPDLLR